MGQYLKSTPALVASQEAVNSEQDLWWAGAAESSNTKGLNSHKKKEIVRENSHPGYGGV